MNWALYAVAGVLAISTLIVIAHAGKDPAKDPVKAGTSGLAAAVTVVNTAMIVVVVMAAIRLS